MAPRVQRETWALKVILDLQGNRATQDLRGFLDLKALLDFPEIKDLQANKDCQGLMEQTAQRATPVERAQRVKREPWAPWAHRVPLAILESAVLRVLMESEE